MVKYSTATLERKIEAAKAEAAKLETKLGEKEFNEEIDKVVVYFKAQEFDKALEKLITITASASDGVPDVTGKAVVTYNMASALHRVRARAKCTIAIASCRNRHVWC